MKHTIIAGPCVIESAELLDTVAAELVRINSRLGTDIIFKASFDKANRTSVSSFRGPGLERGMQMLADIKSRYGLRILTDIHESWQAQPVAEVADVLQIPAFLCRQTDLLVAAAKTGRTVNIKKAQFLSGADMRFPVEKALDAGATEVWLTERGNMFGYNNLVVDFRNIADMLDIVPTVIMDYTHSVQRPGGVAPCAGQQVRQKPLGVRLPQLGRPARLWAPVQLGRPAPRATPRGRRGQDRGRPPLRAPDGHGRQGVRGHGMVL